MSGHSHWARIKHKKGVADARRGRLWSKLVRAVIVAAKEGGGDPNHNLKLAYAVEAAKGANVPRDTLDRAIKKGTGELEGEQIEAVTYEGYAPGGVAILVETLTDNRNRTTSELRKLFERTGGNLAATNAVAWMFERVGMMTIPREAASEDDVLAAALDAGAENMSPEEDVYEVTCPAVELAVVRAKLAERFKVASAELTYVAKTRVQVDEGGGRKLLAFLDQLEDSEDVQQIHANYELPESLVRSL